MANVIQDYVEATRRTRPKDPQFMQMLLGIASEAGEVCGVAEKVFFQGRTDIDLRAQMTKEIGDLLWYVAGAADLLDLKLEDILLANIEKLKIRYEEKFTSEESKLRVDGG